MRPKSVLVLKPRAEEEALPHQIVDPARPLHPAEIVNLRVEVFALISDLHCYGGREERQEFR